MSDAPLGLPKRIRIGPYTIKVVKIQDDEERYGEFCERSQEIFIAEKFACNGVMVDSFLHELLHAIWFAQDVKDGDGEERTVARLATGLTQVLQDNPLVIDWLLRNVKKWNG